MKKPAVVLLLLAACLLCVAAPAHRCGAQEQSVQKVLSGLSDAELGERVSSLVAQIHADVEIVERKTEALQTASREDSLVLRRQLFTAHVRAIGRVHELADTLVELEKQAPTPELRTQVEALYELLTPYLWGATERLRHEIDALRARRASVALDERVALEQHIEEASVRLSEFYRLGAKHFEQLEKLGLDTTASGAVFSRALLDRADELSGRIDLALARIDALNARLAETPDAADVPVLLLAAHRSLATNEAAMGVVLDIMDARGLSTEAYRAQLVTSTRDITEGLLEKGVARELLSGAWASFSRWMSDNGPPFVVKLLVFLVILFVFRVAARVLRKAAEKSLQATKLNVSQLLRRMIVTSISNLVMFLGLLIALSQLGISLGPLLAGVGVAGFIVGFALQDSLSNFASGMMILIYRPYDVGDLVDVGGVFGKVDKMSVVSTSILTVDNQRIMVPNSMIWGGVIKNVTAQKVRRVDMTFGISYSDDIPKAEGVLQDILEKHEKVLAEPEPVVRLHTLGESSVDFVVRPWVAAPDYWDVYWDVTRAVKMRFDEEGISIPFPQRDVHVYEERVAARTNAVTADGSQS